MPEWPDSIPVKDLQRTHPDYRPDLLQRYGDLYEGGDRFERRKNLYLRKRQFEEQGGIKGSAQYKARLRSASYTPHAAGAIDWLQAATFQSEPAIVAHSSAKRTDPALDYWNRLNRDANGRGTDFSALLRSRTLEMLVHGRSYLSVRFPDAGQAASSLAEQRSLGSLDAIMDGLDAKDVDDWQEDENGRLVWIRTHVSERIRSQPYGPENIERHTWTFLDDKTIVEYQASVEIKDGMPRAFKENESAVRVRLDAHQFGRLPVFRIEIPRGLWVMNRLAPIAIALFNREASLDWALDSSAYALPIIKSARDLSQIIGSELTALHLDPSDSFGWSVPPTQHFDALDNRAERLKANLFLAIQAAALIAPGKESSGRQSGVAKFREFGAIATLLSAFASALRDAAEAALEAIRAARSDDVEISLAGLDKFDVQSLELKLKLAESFLALAGRFGSEASAIAREWVLLDISLAMTSAAPSRLRGEVVSRANQLIERIKNGEIKPAVGIQPPPNTPVRTSQTLEVKPIEKTTPP